MKAKKNETEKEFEQTATQQTCPNCGLSKNEWKGNRKQGYQEGGTTYCCQGCADDTGCECQDEDEPEA